MPFYHVSIMLSYLFHLSILSCSTLPPQIVIPLFAYYKIIMNVVNKKTIFNA